MKTIYLIRHGQASVTSKNYDQLSTLGQFQCNTLGEYSANRCTPDQIYTGYMQRHIQSFEYFQKGCLDNLSSHFAERGLDEFDHVDVVKRFSAQWHDIESLSDILNEFESPKVFFKEVFKPAIFSWIKGGDNNYRESFEHFKLRCVNTLKAISKQSEEAKDIYVFTSGGLISAICLHALQLPDAQFFALNSQLVNSSVTKLYVTPTGFIIDYFNNYSHLESRNRNAITRI